MIDLNTLKHAAEFVKNNQGKPVVQIPVDIWDALLEQIEANRPPQQEPDKSQGEKILAVLKEFKANPDPTPKEWWDEFDAFLKENPVTFPERDLHPDDE